MEILEGSREPRCASWRDPDLEDWDEDSGLLGAQGGNK